MIADILQLPLDIPRESDSAALGAAFQAAAVHQGCEIRAFVSDHAPEMEPESIEPDASTQGLYQAALQRHRDYGDLLFGGGNCP
jgi:sugar (pentulose or hexulose) kinase